MIIKGLILGFSTGLFCIGFCYPILGPLMLSRNNAGFKDSTISLSLFMLGRLFAYLLFGIIFGLIGQSASSIKIFHSTLVPIAYLVLGILMVIYGLITSLPQWDLCRVLGKHFQHPRTNLVFGFLTGINICPPFLLAITTAADLAGPWRGLVFFFFFFLATTVYLLPFLFSSLVNRFRDLRVAAKIVAMLAGLWFIYHSIDLIIK